MKHWMLALALTLGALGCGYDSTTPPTDAGGDSSVTTDAGGDSAMGTDAGDAGRCASGLRDCGGGCTDVSSDSLNCGSCGLVCADSTCVGGVCDSSCPVETVVCGVRCCPAAEGCDASGSTCALPCPADPPTDGDACSAAQSCDWLRCATSGHTTASCDGSLWTVTSEACGSFSCEGGISGGGPCTGDQVCNQNVGGAFLTECRANPCGDMPIEKSCACTDCSPENCTISGRTVTCNTCPSGLCP
ncbi:MAG: hypothetical protein GXP55_11375 [Deltaproteobacteria bacterium]|nr:hypothetical protein [Deltaproteobacteria bacterium]